MKEAIEIEIEIASSAIHSFIMISIEMIWKTN